MRKIAWAFACLFIFAASAARADVVANISVSQQRMTVYVDGMPRHTWPVLDRALSLCDAVRQLPADPARALVALTRL